jgi:hypothetical protein
MNLKRDINKISLLAIVGLLFAFRPNDNPKVWTSSDQPQKELEALRKEIKAPTFKNKDYKITDFGAKAGGQINNTNLKTKTIR